MKFTTKPQQVEAIQWTGQNFDEIHAFAAAAIVGRKHELIYLDLSVASAPMKISDYLVLDSLGFSAMEEEDFNTIYEPSTSLALSLNLPTVKPLDGEFIVHIPVILEIPVDPLHGFTEDEAPQVAIDRLAELPLFVTLGGVIIESASAGPSYPLFSDKVHDLRPPTSDL